MTRRSYLVRVEKRAVALLAACVLVITSATQAQFDLSWSTTDGGSGSSIGGGFALTGTAGQSDASANTAMSGGSYTLTGGFWVVTLPRCTSFVRPDFDHDCDVDADDLAVFINCAAGPEVLHDGSTNCQQADTNTDADVDQEDFGVFQRCYSGQDVEAAPGCES